MRNVSLIILPLSVLLGCTAVARAEDGILLTYSLKSSQITLGEPLILDINVSNHLSSAGRIDLGPDCVENLVLGMQDSSGNLKEIPTIVRAGAVSTCIFDLPSAGEQNIPIVLSEWLKPASEGRYTVNVHMRHLAPHVLESGTVLDLRVEGANPDKLKEVCAELSQVALRRDTYRAAEQASKALSLIAYPGCVPYIKSVLLATEHFDPILIDGLAKAGSRESLTALTELANSGRAERAILAKNAMYKQPSR